MEPRVVQFHFDYISPYSYLAWCQIGDFARRNAVRVEPRPTLFAALLNRHGHKGPGEILPKRIYMFKDCIRAAARLGVPFEPVHTHPFNPLPALRASLLEMDAEVRGRLVTRLFDATWAEARDVGSAEVVAELCAEVGVHDALN
ncbi:MAG: 2-hydroxychromene-2-carboxylate isomerase, partial [Polyangiales bacterium]